VSDLTRVVLGVTGAVFKFREYENDVLVEDTEDWYAQDNDGNVWYFGELAREIKDGQIVSTAGSWEAGVNGTLPGIIIMAKPIEGIWYRQEHRLGEAEDEAQVMSVRQTVTVPCGTFTNCLLTAEWNPMEPGILEHDYYAPGIGSIREIAVKGETGFEDLVSFTRP
jgi:hypothetical protein